MSLYPFNETFHLYKDLLKENKTVLNPT